jgi:tetratricopeptide (TPR) repeat protein
MNAKKYLLSLTVAGFVLSALVALPFDISAQAKRDVKKARQAADKARVALGRRDYRVALEGYSQAVALDPDNADYRFWKGASHYYLNEYALAVPELDKAQSMGYKKPLEIYSIRWFSHFKEKNFDAALADVRQGLALDANNLDLLQALGDINYEKNNYPEAVDAYQKVALGRPNMAPDLYYYIARSQANLGNVPAQIAAAEEAVNRRTQFLGEAYGLMADGYRKQRNYDAAIAAYQKAIAAKPNTYSDYENLAEIYRGQGRFNDAIDISRKALGIFPNDGRIYTSLSWLYSLAGRNEEAIQAAQAGIRFLPDQYMAYTNLCRAYNDVNKPEMAIRECNNALRRNPNDGETYFYLARANDLANKPDEATKHYKRAVSGLLEFTRNNPDSADGFYLLGNAYFADNQREKAVDAYEKCLAISPRFVKARYNMAIIQLQQKNKTAALEQYNRLLEMDPDLAGKLKAEIDKS